MKSKIISYGLTDIGPVRKVNQDSIFFDDAKNLYIVADGMGGHNAGELASQMAINLIPKYFEQNLKGSAKAVLRDAIKDANNQIYKKSHSQGESLQGMGTTVTSAFIYNQNAYIGNVGDSRVYLINDQQIFQITKDHSLIQEKINLGIYSREKAKLDDKTNVLIRAVGFEEKVEVDVFTYELTPGDILVLCSDGLHGPVGDNIILDKITNTLKTASDINYDSLKTIVENLVHEATVGGGNDNISVIVLVYN